jgi:photosystem II stability/assembly factor-like uncharacterized protein
MTTPPRARPAAAVACLTLFFFAGKGARAQAVWHQLGPDTGLPSVTTVAFDPQRADVAFAGLNHAGLALSTDGGLRWTHQISQLDGQAPLQVVFSAAQPETLYARTEVEVFRSTDAGTVWKQRGPISDTGLYGLACDPRDANLLYIWGPNGLYLSTDGAATWLRVTGDLHYDAATAFAIDPKTPGRLYLSAHSSQGAGIFVSIDRGAHWKKVANQEAFSIVVSPVDPNVLWATRALDLIVSRDRGSVWSASLLTQDSVSPTVVLADESNGKVAYLGRRANNNFSGESGLLKTIDGGRQWRSLTSGLPRTFEVAALAQDPHDAEHLLLATDTGLFQSSDAGASWSFATGGLINSSALVFAVATDGALFTAVADVGKIELDAPRSGGIFRSRNGGVTWRDVFLQQPTPDGEPASSFRFITTDPNNPAIAYAGTSSDLAGSPILWKTVDGGRTWAPGPAMPYSAADLVVDPRNSDVLYLATSPCCRAGELFKSTDAGATWQGSLLSPPGVNEIAMDLTNPDILYAAAGALYKSTDAGASWTQLVVPTGADTNIQSVTLAPQNPQVVVAGDGYTNQIYRSEDGGATWTVTGGPGFPRLGIAVGPGSHHPLAIDPQNAERLYAAGIGVQVLDVGGSWHRLGAPPLGEAVTQIGFVSPTCLLAGTPSEGLLSFGLVASAPASGGPIAGCGLFEPVP